jgi:eukaryotic-like serine/threonine-protein kinase
MSTPETAQTQLGRYTLLGKIGAGGMAEVYLARSRGASGLEKTLVIKKIHPVLARNTRFIDMFVEEARVAMRLNHTNIVQVYAFEKIEESYVLAMEHVDGCDLHEIQTLAYHQGHRIPFGLCAYITAEIAKGLEYAHSRKDDRGAPLELVHRDVSPQNVLISKDGAVKVTDFGIVKARSVNEKEGEVKGKLGYMSPQQALGLPVDRRADLYSLGVVLHELLVGASPVKPQLGEVVKLAPPLEIDPSVPVELSNVAERALAHDTEKRYQTARELAADLRAYLHKESDIYDAHTLESWISDTIPKDKLRKVKIDSEVTEVTNALTRTFKGSEQQMGEIGESERQPVIMVSVSLSISPHPERVAIHGEFNRLAEEISYKAAAIFRSSDNGIQIFFGLPVGILEDAISAIRLANDLLDVVHTLSEDNRIAMDVRFSVTRGQVRLQKTADADLIQFDPDEDLVADGTRLIDSCPPGAILSCARVYRLARTDYHFESPQSVSAGDSAAPEGVEPLMGYRVLGVKSREERQIVSEQDNVAFIGRELEVARITDAYRVSMTGRPTLLKVTGELGLGKSRILRHFIDQIRVDNVHIIRIECLFAERDTPLAATVETLRSILAIDEHYADFRLDHSLAPLLGRAPNYFERQRAFLEGLFSSSEDVWARAHDRQRDLIRRTAFALGVLLTRLAAEKGVVLVVDNAHWMDGPSVDILSELASNIVSAPVFVVFMGPPETLTGRRIENLDRMEISELSESVMRRIIASRLGSGGGIEEISQQILERSHGNPFFASEIIDSLIERGILQEGTRDGSGEPVYRQARPGAIRLPTTMEGIATSRIDTLDAALRATLRTAAAIGSNFTTETIEALMGRRVLEDLKTLVQKKFLVELPQARQGVASYRFKKPMEREAAYAGLSRNDKQRIHQSEARRLIALMDGGHPVPPDRVAWHLDRSEQKDLAARYYLEAGKEAISAYSNRRALVLIDRALSLMPAGSASRYQGLVSRERVLRDLGMHDEHLETIREMEELGQLFNDPRMLGQASYRFAWYEFNEGNFDEAARKFTNTLQYARKSSDRVSQVETLRAIGYLCIEKGQLNQAMNCCRWALSLISDTPDDLYLRGRILGFQGLVLMEMGRIEDAAVPLASAMLIFRRLGDKRNESTQLGNLGLLAQARGNLLESVEFLEHAVSIDRQIRDVSERGRKLVACADARVEMGDFEQGKKLLGDALRICRNNYEPIGEVEAELGLAQLELERGNPDAAMQLVFELLDNSILAGSRISHIRHRQILAAACIQTGDFVRARKAAEEATILAQSSQMAAEVIHGAALRGVALAHLGQHVDALAATDRLEEMVDALGGIRLAEVIWWRWSRTLEVCGDREGAARALNRARGEVARKAELITNPKHRLLFNEHPRIRAILTERPIDNATIA